MTRKQKPDANPSTRHSEASQHRPHDKPPKKKSRGKLGKKVKKTSRRVKFILFLILILAAVLAYYFGYNYGYNLGGGTSDKDNGQSSTELNLQSDETDETVTKDISSIDRPVIRVRDDIIFLNEEEITLEELTSALDEMDKEDLIISVIDNVSIETTLNSVIDLLNLNEIDYVLVEDGNIQ